MLRGADGIGAHYVEQVFQLRLRQPVAFAQQRTLLIAVLLGALAADVLLRETHVRQVLLVELRQVDAMAPFEALLVEVDAAQAVLHLVEVLDHVNHEVVRAHITQQPCEAALVEFHELLAEPHRVDIAAVVRWVLDEIVPGHTDDMLLHQRASVHRVVDAVGT